MLHGNICNVLALAMVKCSCLSMGTSPEPALVVKDPQNAA